MVSIKELRILMPFTMEEYQRGSLWSLQQAALEKADEGKIMLVQKKEQYTNHPKYGSGEHAIKLFYLKDEVPALIRPFLPDYAAIMKEASWTFYPRYHCEYTMDYFGRNFDIFCDTCFVADQGTSENVFGLSQSELALRKVVMVNLLDQCSEDTYDPSKYTPEPSIVPGNRGPVTRNWVKTRPDLPCLCCYKLVRTNVSFGVGFIIVPRVESIQIDILLKLMRRIFCTMEQWWLLSYTELKEREMVVERRIVDIAMGMRLPEALSSLASLTASLSPSVSQEDLSLASQSPSTGSSSHFDHSTNYSSVNDFGVDDKPVNSSSNIFSLSKNND